jgi:two-component system nitrate/nitrite response regulator NarL
MAEEKETLRILIVCDDPLARVGLVTLLREKRGLTIAGGGKSDTDFVSLAATSGADAFLWDLGNDPRRGPGTRPQHAESGVSQTIGQTAYLLSQSGLPVVALVPDGTAAHRVLEAGIAGILPRESDPDSIGAALRAAAQGLFVSDPSLWVEGPPPSFGPLRSPHGGPRYAREERALIGPSKELTPREREVLALVAAGHPNKTIAHRLGISEHTVKFHVNSIMMKLGAQSRTDAAVRGTRLGLLPL